MRYYILHDHNLTPLDADLKDGVLVNENTGLPIPRPTAIESVAAGTEREALIRIIADAEEAQRRRGEDARSFAAEMKSAHHEIRPDKNNTQSQRQLSPESRRLRSKYKKQFAEHAAHLKAYHEHPVLAGQFLQVNSDRMLSEKLSDDVPVLTQEDAKELCKFAGFYAKHHETGIVMALGQIDPNEVAQNSDVRKFITKWAEHYIDKNDLAGFTEFMTGPNKDFIYAVLKGDSIARLGSRSETDPFMEIVLAGMPKTEHAGSNQTLESLIAKAIYRNDIKMLDRLDPNREGISESFAFTIEEQKLRLLAFALLNNDTKLERECDFITTMKKDLERATSKTAQKLFKLARTTNNLALMELIDPERKQLLEMVADKDAITLQKEALAYALNSHDDKALKLIDPDGQLSQGRAGNIVRQEQEAAEENKALALKYKKSTPEDDVTKPIPVQNTTYAFSGSYLHPEFSKDVYEQVFPFIAKSFKMEGASNPESEAGKLAVLFSDGDAALAFLRKRVKSFSKSSQPVHDALLFDLPPAHEWHPKSWGKLITRLGAGVLNSLTSAPQIEVAIEEQNQRQAGTFRYQLEKLSIEQLSGFCKEIQYKDGHLDQELAGYCGSLVPKISQEGFMLGVEARKKIPTEDNIPDIGIIDGATFGFRKFYMVKMSKTDVRMPLLGRLVDCCNHLDGATKAMAIAMVTSPDAGAYVLFEKSGNEPDMEHDRIVGKVTVFRSENHEQPQGKPYSNIVFNSWERLTMGEIVNARAEVGEGSQKKMMFLGEAFLKHAAEAALKNDKAPEGMAPAQRVTLGRNRDNFASFPEITDIEKPRSADTTSPDSETQYEVANIGRNKQQGQSAEQDDRQPNRVRRRPASFSLT